MNESILKRCPDCIHHRQDEDGWDWCERPNVPGDINLLCEVQRYSKSEQCCGGRYWEAKE